ncbi:hypothetical protein E4U30_005670 [Claviceps sp. LM220 group G6]|nr:hypothetical protein E4U15_001045 [Claviceps sp. LM218 group G6]KAG6092256.1 hypothetical protein E4U30_005670 [Claviceps sp. LM220 group G6]KAG6113469.1 hypothetical protein E4U31_000703 [Claviceps sp. LM219 group G6]
MWRCTGPERIDSHPQLLQNWSADSTATWRTFLPIKHSFHQNSKASVSAQLAVKLIDFSCFSRSTSQ